MTFKTIEHGFKNLIRSLLLPSACRALQAQCKELTTVEGSVDLAFRFRHRGIGVLDEAGANPPAGKSPS